MIRRSVSTAWTFTAACESMLGRCFGPLQDLDGILKIESTGHGLVSELLSEDVPRARLVQATVSTSKRRSSGSRIDSRVL